MHAFEPNPRMLDFLRTTAAANEDAPLRIHPIALGSREEMLELIVPDDNAGAASFLSIGGRPEAKRLKLPVVPLVDFCARNGIEKIDFIKIDVEGFESDVLLGAEAILRANPPRAILLEDNDFRKKEESHAFRILESWGFNIFALPKNLLRNRLVPLTSADARTAHDFVAIPQP